MDRRGHEKCEDGQAEDDDSSLYLAGNAPGVPSIIIKFSGERSTNDSKCRGRTGLAHTGTIPTGS